tara:strand:+ start:199 stop:1014 length:816 start_codon:yes stop_codon:yes gene_type:complete
MAYPIVSAPYGLKPVNLIGGQVFAGSTRNIPIQYAYNVNIGYGDPVVIASGTITRVAIAAATTGKQITGIFLGCSYTSPITKQKLFSQYWPAGTLAGDAVAVVCDDPDTVFKVVMLSAAAGTVTSGSQALVGLNVAGADAAANIATGNSTVGAVTPAATPTTGLAYRILETVKESAVNTAVPSTSTTTVTITVPALTSALIIGSEVSFVAANGQVVNTGSFLVANYAIGVTSIVMNAASGVTIPASAVLVITQYPEVLVKINFGIHSYYGA